MLSPLKGGDFDGVFTYSGSAPTENGTFLKQTEGTAIRTFFRSIATWISNRIGWYAPIRKLSRRKPIVEIIAIFGIVIGGIVVTAFMLEGLLGGVRSEVEATFTVERNKNIRVSSSGSEMALGNFQVVRSLGSVPQANSLAGNQNQIQIVEMDARAVLNTVNKREIVDIYARMENHNYRIRELFDETLRKATREDISEPDLSTLRKRIRTGLNDMLGTNTVDDVVIPHFRAVRVPAYRAHPEMKQVSQ